MQINSISSMQRQSFGAIKYADNTKNYDNWFNKNVTPRITTETIDDMEALGFDIVYATEHDPSSYPKVSRYSTVPQIPVITLRDRNHPAKAFKNCIYIPVNAKTKSISKNMTAEKFNTKINNLANRIIDNEMCE